jgi:exosortase
MILPLMDTNATRPPVMRPVRVHWSRRAIASWHLGGALLLAAMGVWVRSADWLDIWNIFRRDEEASHVILAPLVAAILIWVRRERLRRIRLRTSWLGPIVVAAGCVIAYLGDDHGYQSMRHFGAVTLLAGCFVTMLGREFLINFAPAFLALVFLIPMPPMFRQKISLPLESVNAHITEDLLNVFGIPATRSGNQLFVNGRAISIVEACNGLRGFFTLVMVAYLVAFIVSLRVYVRVLLVALSPVAAIICNVIRLVLTVGIYGYMSGPAGDAFHDMSGWIMLPLAFAMLYGVVGALRWAMVPVSPFTLARD